MDVAVQHDKPKQKADKCERTSVNPLRNPREEKEKGFGAEAHVGECFTNRSQTLLS